MNACAYGHENCAWTHGPESVSRRAELLDEAKSYVDNDRNTAYDAPERNFARIAGQLNALGYRKPGPEDGDDGAASALIEPHDVAIMMVAVKQARLMVSPGKRDNWTDTAGYAACGWDAYEATREGE